MAIKNSNEGSLKEKNEQTMEGQEETEKDQEKETETEKEKEKEKEEEAERKFTSVFAKSGEGGLMVVSQAGK